MKVANKSDESQSDKTAHRDDTKQSEDDKLEFLSWLKREFLKALNEVHLKVVRSIFFWFLEIKV